MRIAAKLSAASLPNTVEAGHLLRGSAVLTEDMSPDRIYVLVPESCAAQAERVLTAASPAKPAPTVIKTKPPPSNKKKTWAWILGIAVPLHLGLAVAKLSSRSKPHRTSSTVPVKVTVTRRVFDAQGRPEKEVTSKGVVVSEWSYQPDGGFIVEQDTDRDGTMDKRLTCVADGTVLRVEVWRDGQWTLVR